MQHEAIIRKYKVQDILDRQAKTNKDVLSGFLKRKYCGSNRFKNRKNNILRYWSNTNVCKLL